VAWPAQVQNSRPAARRRYQSKVGIEDGGLSKPELLLSPARLHTTAGVEDREGRVLTHNPAPRRLRAQQVQAKHGPENKKGKVPLFNLTKLRAAVPLRANAVKEKPSMGRKRVKRLPRLLVLNNTNLVWDKRRPRKCDPGPLFTNVRWAGCCCSGVCVKRRGSSIQAPAAASVSTTVRRSAPRLMLRP
jgi:hypothetical protein